MKIHVFWDVKSLKTLNFHLIVLRLSLNNKFFFILYSELDHTWWFVLRPWSFVDD